MEADRVEVVGRATETAFDNKQKLGGDEIAARRVRIEPAEGQTGHDPHRAGKAAGGDVGSRAAWNAMAPDW